MDDMPEMIDDLVEFWHSQPSKLLDDAAHEFLERWIAAGRIAPLDAKVDVILPDGSHRYWSTWCRHGLHGPCGASNHIKSWNADGSPRELYNTPREPAQCKTCTSPCICTCHKEASSG